ncbi:MAG TPA: cell division protein ZapA, partial [bacterium]|nr:cell division protein ZapA [bacterium]
VEILNKRIAKISETIKAASSLDIAIFTALSFVDDLVKQQNGKQIKTDEDDIEKYLSKIINTIDNKLQKN